MNDLALAYVTCDKYSYVWNEWYDAFVKHWNTYKIPMYFLGEENSPNFVGFKYIPHNRVAAEHWTSKLRTQVEQIPEDNIFIWLDDHVQQFPIDDEFEKVYDWHINADADATRIMGRASKARYAQVGDIFGRPVYKLKMHSPYLVSFSPNIYKKEFLLKVLEKDESPWDVEIKGSRRVLPWRKIYAYHILIQ